MSAVVRKTSLWFGLVVAMAGTNCRAAESNGGISVIVDSSSALTTMAEQAAEAAVTSPGDSVQATLLGAWGLESLRGPTRFVLKVTDQHPSSSPNWVDVHAVRASTDASSGQEITLRYRIEISRPVYAAMVPMRQGDAFSCGNFRTQMHTMHGDTADQLWRGTCTAVHALVLRRPLQPGDVLLQTDVSPAPEVSRNRQVQATVAVGAVKVETPAVALVDGVLGQQVRIRLLNGQSTLSATVVGMNHVAVDEALP